MTFRVPEYIYLQGTLVCVCECINVYVHIMDVNNYLSIYIYPEYIYQIFLSNFIYL